MKYYLAIDIGASSGRHILAWKDNGKLCLEEVYRFKNYMEEKNGHLCWDIDRLFGEIKAGIKKCGEIGKIPCSMGIDTWGVDFILLDKDDNILGDTVAYRDSRTTGIPDEVYSLIPKKDLYAKTGIQEQVFNTVFQLMAIKNQTPELLEKAETMLFLPCAFSYFLTGNKINEYTIASTGGMLDAHSGEWDAELIDLLGLPEKLFTPLAMPKTVAGSFMPEIIDEVGFDCTVILPPMHDTASAVLSVPMEKGDDVYISSGTWSLMGVELNEPICTWEASEEGFTNEGGIEKRYRFLKNIMGLWIIQSIKKELNDEYSFADLEKEARGCADFSSVIDVNDGRFLAPKSMIEAIKGYCEETNQQIPESVGELMQCAYVSLARCYAKSVKGIEKIQGKECDSIRIVGGGSRDGYLNYLTAAETGKTVYAGPIEATAIGNIAAQLMADGTVETVEAMRSLIRASFPITEVKA